MDTLLKLREKLAQNASRRAALQCQINELDIEDHKIKSAIEVIASLMGVSHEAADSLSASKERETSELAKPSVKTLILQELAKASPLTKMDIVSRLYTEGYRVNGSTVGSLLSRMVNEEIEKASPSTYRLRGENPAATGFSGATTSEQDKL
jgi:hypothetical protein